jgi:hypothetical protein
VSQGKGGETTEEGEEGDEELVETGVVGDGEEFEGFQARGGLALLKSPSGAGGGLRLRLRRARILVRNRTLTLSPSNREKALGTLYPPLVEQRKTMKRQILTEVSTRAKSQRVALTQMDP